MKDNIEIKVPDGYKFKEIKEGNVVFEPIQKIDYNYVIEQLDLDLPDSMIVTFRCYSRKQCEKLRAIHRLLNVAKYLNRDWKPDFSNLNEYKYYIKLEENNKIDFDFHSCYNRSIIYFKTEELAQQAIEILGEDTIKLALTTDY